MALKLLYAVCRTLDDSVDKPYSNPEYFLHSWRQVFETGDPAHVREFGYYELASRFLVELKNFDIPVFPLLDLIEKGVSVDLKRNRFETPMDTESYCYGVAGTVGIACLAIFGVPLEQGKDFAVRLGITVQWINLIRDVGVDARLGRVYLPMDHLEKFDCSEEEILSCVESPKVRRLMEYEASVARGHYRRAMELYPKQWKKELLPARIMGKIYLKLLEKIASQGYPVIQKSVKLNIFEKGMAVWSAIQE